MSKYAEIRARICDLQKQADDIYIAEKKAAIAEIKDKIKTYDITAAEIGLVKRERAASVTKAVKLAASPKKAATKPGAKAKAKTKTKTKTQVSAALVAYKGPNGETWGGGRGKRPNWVNAILAAGGDIEEYRVA
jgi:DNA-binding protein H-NS